MERVLRSLLLGLCLALLCAATPAPQPTYLFGKTAEAEWSWLPYYGDELDAWSHHTATLQTSAHFDRFVYHGRVVSLTWDGIEPADGKRTAVWLPGAGGRGRIVYDYAHRLVFYKVACCSDGEMVLAVSGKNPVDKLPGTDLSAVRTQHGLRLGDSVAKVRRIDGAALLEPVPHRPKLRRLAYAAMYDGKVAPKWCGQWQNFVFREDRLISIEFMNGC